MKKMLMLLLVAITLYSCMPDTQPPPPAEPASASNSNAFAIPPQEKISINFGPFEKGQSPHRGDVLSPEQLRRRLEIVKPGVAWIRTYGMSNGLDTIPGLARSMGLQVAAGAWLDSDLKANEREISRLISIGRTGQADLLVVGSETLRRQELNPKQLTDYIRRVKAAVPNFPVTTADAADTLIAHPGVVAACDLVFANFYPYWEGHSIECAVYHLDKKYRELKAVAGAKEVRISESGWPSAGNSVNEAQPGPGNAVTYLRQLLAWAKINAVQVFVFEAFDESWKARDEGPQGAHWGLFDESGRLKPSMQAIFETPSATPNWKDCSTAVIHRQSD